MKTLDRIDNYLTEGTPALPNGIVLKKAQIVGTSNGQDLKQPYRAVIVQEKGKWLLYIEQSFDKGGFNKYSVVPSGWSLGSLLQNPRDFLYIDMGQKWGVKGLHTALKDALNYI